MPPVRLINLTGKTLCIEIPKEAAQRPQYLTVPCVGVAVAERRAQPRVRALPKESFHIRGFVNPTGKDTVLDDLGVEIKITNPMARPVYNLPEPIEGTLYVVNKDVLIALNCTRQDVVSPTGNALLSLDNGDNAIYATGFTR